MVNTLFLRMHAPLDWVNTTGPLQGGTTCTGAGAQRLLTAPARPELHLLVVFLYLKLERLIAFELASYLGRTRARVPINPLAHEFKCIIIIAIAISRIIGSTPPHEQVAS